MTTILSVRKGSKVAIGGDGQVSLGHTVMKNSAVKIRRLYKEQILSGFAGSTSDAFTLFERLEGYLEKYNGHLLRASTELVKGWRSDKYLRKLEAMMIVADKENTYIISGMGDVLEPEDGIAAIGSGGNYALAAAKALSKAEKDPSVIVKDSMKIAADICIYTNHNIKIDSL